MCEKRKLMEHFYIKKPPYIPKKQSFTNERYRRCKECHKAWNRKLYLKRTAKEERRVYMTKYMRVYNDVQTYRVAA